ncbi:putative aminoacrylate hydrolase RutD [Agaricicola taiwanensis]|uniref:Putative aminoacrylate hydrolase RutD n=2 Tax=Agaricicola taiwanensis TaxID=591372 RepID=A0A8J3DY01_9RHOB|nr:putative aminoacrylate hydrolase RutD [Agaricicola taiwanensis]
MIHIRDGVDIHYEDHCFVAPWRECETVLMIHGIAESGVAWTEWVPPLSAHYRMLRPDLPGFGRSPVPETYSWSAGELADDLIALMDKLGVERFHVVGAKYGGTVSMVLASKAGKRLRSLSLLGAPHKGDGVGAFPKRVSEIGVAGWAGETQRSRLGPEASDAQVDWWTHQLMGKSDARPTMGASGWRAKMQELDKELRAITAPTLVITTEESGLQSVETARGYQEKIPNSRLVVMPGKAYHVAVVRPQECAGQVLEFMASDGT